MIVPPQTPSTCHVPSTLFQKTNGPAIAAPTRLAIIQPSRTSLPALERVVVGPDVGAGVSIAVPSMFVVAGSEPGVAKVKTPQTTWEPVKVVLHDVCVGPVTVPSV